MSSRRNALGRGLGALISNTETEPARDDSESSESTSSSDSRESASSNRAPDRSGEEAVSRQSSPRPSETDAAAGAAPELLIDSIDPNPDQPRRVFDPKELQALSASIRDHGVLQPIVVRRAGSRYELIVGERRWRASRAAGKKTIPAVVSDTEDRLRLELAIIENVQRHDLNPIELAHAYQALADGGATQDEIGKKVSKDRSSIANHLRLLELSKDLQQDVEHGRITMGHAKALLQVANPERRRHLRNRVVAEGLSVRESERVGREIAGPSPHRKSPPPKASAGTDPHLAALGQTLARELQTRVKLKGDGKRGQIEIEYFSADDLDRIARILMEGR